MSGIDKKTPIERAATRVLLDGIAFTPALGVALLKEKILLNTANHVATKFSITCIHYQSMSMFSTDARRQISRLSLPVLP
eukprot:10016292-Karenia_brevis.AAC.1